MREELEKNFIDKAKKISLSQQKKESIRHAIIEYSREGNLATSQQLNLSPFFTSFAKGFSFALVILIVGGSTITYASNNTLPGDLLYTVKVNFTEPLERSLRFSQEAKMQTKTKHIERRLTEAQILIKKDIHTEDQHEQIRKRIERQIQEIKTSIDTLETNGQTVAVLEVTSRLDSVLKAHKNILNQNTQNTTLLNVTTKETESPSGEVETKTSKPQESLLTMVDNLIKQIEGKESSLLAQIQNNREVNETNNITQQRMRHAQERIVAFKKELENEKIALEDVKIADESEIDIFLQRSSEKIENNLRNNISEIILVEAEIVLHTAQKLFENGKYQEALIKAQEAIKLTESIQTNKRIEELLLLLQVNNTVNKENVTEENTINKEDINVESQAIEAIKDLEEKLKENTQSQ